MVRGIGRKTASAAALGVLLALCAGSPASATVFYYDDSELYLFDSYVPPADGSGLAAVAGGGGVTLTASSKLHGLGHTDVLVTVEATGETVATCRNPANGEQRLPGQNPAPTRVVGSVSIPQSVTKNGRAPFTVTSQPVTVVPGAPDCPNPNWTEEIVDLRFTAATLTVVEPPGVVAATATCTISPPSSDGPIPAADVSCTFA